MRHSLETKLRAEIKTLRAWKRQALKVMNMLQEQSIAKELNLQLGVQVSPHILPAIRRFKSKIGELETRLSEARRRSVSLHGDSGEINFLPLYVTEIHPETDTIDVHSIGSSFAQTMAVRRRVMLTIEADLCDPPQITSPSGKIEL